MSKKKTFKLEQLPGIGASSWTTRDLEQEKKKQIQREEHFMKLNHKIITTLQTSSKESEEAKKHQTIQYDYDSGTYRVVDDNYGTLYQCNPHGSRLNKFFPKITGQKGFSERTHLQITRPNQVYLKGVSNTSLAAQKRIVKSVILQDQKANPRAYQEIPNVDKFIDKQILATDSLHEQCRLPVLRSNQKLQPIKSPRRHPRTDSVLAQTKEKELSKIKRDLQADLKQLIQESQKPKFLRRDYDGIMKKDVNMTDLKVAQIKQDFSNLEVNEQLRIEKEASAKKASQIKALQISMNDSSQLAPSPSPKVSKELSITQKYSEMNKARAVSKFSPRHPSPASSLSKSPMALGSHAKTIAVNSTNRLPPNRSDPHLGQRFQRNSDSGKYLQINMPEIQRFSGSPGRPLRGGREERSGIDSSGGKQVRLHESKPGLHNNYPNTGLSKADAPEKAMLLDPYFGLIPEGRGLKLESQRFSTPLRVVGQGEAPVLDNEGSRQSLTSSMSVGSQGNLKKYQSKYLELKKQKKKRHVALRKIQEQLANQSSMIQ